MGRDLWRSVVQDELTVNSDQGALGFVLLAVEILHGWRHYVKPVIVLDSPHSKVFFLKSSWNLSFQFIPVASMDQLGSASSAASL